MPLTGFSSRPNTAFQRQYERFRDCAAFQVSSQSSRSKIVLDPGTPTSPKVVLHLEAEVGSVNMKRSADKGSFGTSRNNSGGFFT